VYAVLADGTYVKLVINADGTIKDTYTDGNTAKPKEIDDRNFIKDEPAQNELYEKIKAQIEDYIKKQGVERPLSRNLLKNPGFAESDSELKYWNAGGDAKVDTSEQQATKNSASLTARDGKDASITQMLSDEDCKNLKLGDIYQLSAWIKTGQDDVDYELLFIKKKAGGNEEFISGAHSSVLALTISQDVDCFGVKIIVHKGALWIDDIELKKVQKEKNCADYAKEECPADKCELKDGKCQEKTASAASKCSDYANKEDCNADTKCTWDAENEKCISAS